MSEIVMVRRQGSGMRLRDKLQDEQGKPRLAAAAG
jgi:hypothetical protein